jgi:hypothetical protein
MLLVTSLMWYLLRKTMLSLSFQSCNQSHFEVLLRSRSTFTWLCFNVIAFMSCFCLSVVSLKNGSNSGITYG